MKRLPLLLVLLLAACATQSPAPWIIPHKNLDSLKYYQELGKSSIVVEFSHTQNIPTIASIGTSLEKSGAQTTLVFSLYGTLGGKDTPLVQYNTNHNQFFSLDPGPVDVTNLKVMYKDDTGLHPVPSAGILTTPVKVDAPPPLSDTFFRPASTLNTEPPPSIR